MNAPLDFPPLLQEPQQPAALAPLSIKETVLAQFRAEEPALLALAAKWRDVAFDCRTTKGLQAAKDARHELRTTGRYSLQNAEKRIKGEVNELKALMTAEVERLIGIVKPVEDGIDGQIKAREAELKAKRLAREKAEAERRAQCEADIALIAGYVDQARGRTSAEIAQALNFVRESIVIDPEAWGDYTARTHATLNATVQALERMQGEAAAEEARRAEAERVAAENARIAAELEAQRAALAAQQAEIDCQRAEIEARQRAEAEAEAERLRSAAAAAFADDEDAPAEDPAAERRAEQAATTYPSGAPMFGTTVKENGDLMMLDPQGKRSVFCDVDEGPETVNIDPIPAVTGTPDGHLLQDMSRALSQALASKPDAMLHAREASAAIAADLQAGQPIDPAAGTAGTYYAPPELAESPGRHTEAPQAGTEPTLSLTDLSQWFGLRLPQDFVADTLGVLPRGESKRKTPLYAEADKAAIKAAMLVYVEGLPE